MRLLLACGAVTKRVTGEFQTVQTVNISAFCFLRWPTDTRKIEGFKHARNVQVRVRAIDTAA